MAKCKSCKKGIPEGSVYCEDCLHKDGTKSNESYLDNLLNSVIKPDGSNNTDFIDDQDLKDFDQFNMAEDLEDAEDFKDQDDFSDLDEEISISDEELFGISLGDEDEDGDEELFGISLGDEDGEEELFGISLGDEDQDEEEDEEGNTPLVDEVNTSESEDEDVIEELEDIMGVLGIDELVKMEQTEASKEDIAPMGPSDDMDLDNTDEDNVDNANLSSDIDEDILSLLNQMSSDDPFMSGITDMLEGKVYDETEEKEETNTVDINDIIAKELAGATPIDEDDMVAEISQNLSAEELEKKKLDKQEKLRKLTSETDTMVLPENSKEEAKKKPSIFSKIFGGSASKSSESEKTPDITDNDPVNEETGDKKTAKKSSKKAAKNKRASKKAKGTNKSLDANTEDNGEDQESNAQTSKKQSKREARKAKKAEKRKTKAITKVVEEVEEDPGTINPVGTTVVLVVFGAIAALIYFGTHSFAYNSGITNANNYFSKREYTKAYEAISGMELKEDNVEIFNKLQTVMLVNKQLNSYYNYSKIGKYPEALDSLLKGLRRYDKYIDLATFYGIKSDLDYVRDQIVAELGNGFNITEDEAIDMNNISNKTEYSTMIYKVAMENN